MRFVAHLILSTRARKWTWSTFAAVFFVHLFLLYSPSSGMASPFAGFDKLMHAVGFTALTTPLLLLGFRPLATMLAMSAYAAISEFIQAFAVPGRSGEFGDWIADCLGILLAFGIWRALPAGDPLLGENGEPPRPPQWP
ncbi:hypothetical protein CJ198_03700 [Brevibacterium luteolum]|uniref:VanZ-like domain-containing protein n=1 Tax=Brevibacterium luteolum TaxID=199591 RepID=A0A2N6PIE0_9MICO|nr:hypothetical protein CJ198_03700 [Brevibacterium luteolum]